MVLVSRFERKMKIDLKNGQIEIATNLTAAK